MSKTGGSKITNHKAQLNWTLNVKDESDKEYELGWLLSAIHRAISVAPATTRTKGQVSFAHASMATASVRNTQFADYLRDLQSKRKAPGEGICATGFCYSQKPKNCQDNLLISSRFALLCHKYQSSTDPSTKHNAEQRLHKHENHLLILLTVESDGTSASLRRALMRQYHDIEPATT